MRDRRRVIHMFPRPSPQRPFNIMEWVWCATNSAVNVLLVLLCSVGMEPLRILPWDRPESSTKVELLEKAEFMPDWHRHRGLQPFNSAMSDSEDHRPKWLPSGHGLRMALIYASTLSFSDSTLAIFEDVAQFVLQIMFLMSCHPTESAALTTLLSVVFSMLRAGLKLASALSDDVVKQITRSISIYTMSSLHRFATRSARSHVAPSSAPAATEQGLSGTGNSRVMGDVRMSSEADKAFGSTPHSENNIYNLLTVQSFNNHDGREATGDLQHFPKH
uniref:Uncharacterized protein n=2 Tax=Tetraselmis sp. GSL018 TaxID=582737 RepID=A0A061RV89_9CHLO